MHPLNPKSYTSSKWNLLTVVPSTNQICNMDVALGYTPKQNGWIHWLAWAIASNAKRILLIGWLCAVTTNCFSNRFTIDKNFGSERWVPCQGDFIPPVQIHFEWGHNIPFSIWCPDQRADMASLMVNEINTWNGMEIVNDCKTQQVKYMGNTVLFFVDSRNCVQIAMSPYYRRCSLS